MKLFLSFQIAVTMFAQAGGSLFDKAPPDVDNSLRERVKAFYQCHIDGTYRKAEKYVAEESQDFYYQIQKQKYESCELLRITYEEKFTRATVTQACKGKWNIGGNDMTTQMALSSTWIRKDGGDWFWTHLVPQRQDGPFGKFKYDNGAPGAAAPAAPVAAPSLNVPTDMKAAGEMLMKQVSADKSEVKLSSFENSSDQIVVANKSGGAVKLSYDYEKIIPGFKAEFDKTEVPAGGTAILKFTMAPKDKVAKPTLMTRILVEPLFQQFNVKVTFAIPPEIEKMLPKPAGKK